MTLTVEQEQLVLDHVGLSHHFAHKYFHEFLTHEDLVSVAHVGLIKASKSFDPSRGLKFSTLAGRSILNEIFMTFRKERIKAVSSTQCYGKSEGVELIDYIPDDMSIEYDVQTKLDLKTALSRLNKRDRDVLLYRYGLTENKEELSQTELAKMMGCSQSYVSRVERLALSKLKELLT